MNRQQNRTPENRNCIQHNNNNNDQSMRAELPLAITNGNRQDYTRPHRKQFNKRPVTINSINCWSINAIQIGPEITIMVSINGYVTEAIIDTGSVITVITKIISEILKLKLFDCDKDVRAANGEKMNIYGGAEVEIAITENDMEYSCRINVLVTDKLPYLVLLGNNFFQNTGMVIDFSNNKVSFNYFPQENYKTVVSAETNIIPSFESKAILSNLSLMERECSSILIEPDLYISALYKIIPPRALYQQNHGRTHVMISNISVNNFIIRKGMKLGNYIDCNTIESESKAINKTNDNQFNFENVICGELNINQKEKLIKMLNEYRNVFSFNDDQIGCTIMIEVSINIGDNFPVWSKPYNYCAQDRIEINQQVNSLLELDIIEPSHSSWASPVVLVKAPGRSPRLCVDFRKLNSISKRTSYPLPRVDHALSSLKGTKYFSTLDMCQAYHQVPMHEKSKELTAFITSDGLFQYKRLPFGLASAGPIFQSLMDIVLAGLKWNICLLYLDDICVFSSTFDEHIERLKWYFHV